MVVEKVILAEEIIRANELADNFLKEASVNVPIEYISHEKSKALSKGAKVNIRTGEIQPYADMILQAGVFFREEVDFVHGASEYIKLAAASSN